jgi:probable HAF family extracellular repeat protein
MRLLLITAVFVSSVGWTIRVLGPLPGGPASNANAINERGEVAGHAQNAAGIMRAVYWSATGAITEIPTPAITGRISVAEDINDHGYVVGRMGTTTSHANAFVWRPGTLTNLGASAESRAFAISNDNHVAGQWNVAGTPWRYYAVVWGGATPGSPYFLGGWGGWVDLASDIGDWAPVVAGMAAYQTTGYRHAFLWMDSGGMRDLGTLGGNNSYGRALYVGTWPDYAGETIYVTGESETVPGDFNTTPFLWHRGTMISIGLLPGCTGGYAYGINKNKDVVGTCSGGGTSRAFLWTGGLLIDLNTVLPAGSGWDSVGLAMDVNDLGQIVGTGSYKGAPRAFILSPW